MYGASNIQIPGGVMRCGNTVSMNGYIPGLGVTQGHFEQIVYTMEEPSYGGYVHHSHVPTIPAWKSDPNVIHIEDPTPPEEKPWSHSNTIMNCLVCKDNCFFKITYKSCKKQLTCTNCNNTWDA